MQQRQRMNVRIAFVGLFISRRPKRQCAGQVGEQQNDGRHSADRREQPKLLDGNKIACVKRYQPQCGGECCKGTGEPTMLDGRDASPFGTVFVARFPIVVHNVNRAGET